MASNKRICIVDDDAVVRDSLTALLSSAGYDSQSFETVASFKVGLARLKCHCILLDVRLPDGDGIDVLRELTEAKVSMPVIIITGHGDVQMAVKAMRIGAADFLEKPFDPESLLEIIERACQAFDKESDSQLAVQQASMAFEKLTPREAEVMKHLVDGQPNKIIAFELGLSPRTVELHRARVMEKTKARSLSHLVRMAIVAGVEN